MDEGYEGWKMKGNQIKKEVTHYLETLEASLRKKEGLLVSLIRLTKEQEEALKQEEFDVDLFDRLMEKKASLLEAINLLDDGFESIFSLVKENVLENPKEYKDIVQEMQKRIKSLTDKGVELEVIERRNQLKLEYAISKDRTKIKQFHVNNGAAAKYYSNMMKGGERANLFLDKKK